LKSVVEFAKADTRDRLLNLSPAAMLVLADVLLWCSEKGLNPIVSGAASTLFEDQVLKRVSATHREGRAFDISARGLTKENIDEIIRVFSAKYRYLAALGKDGQPKLCYFHNAGQGDHIHFQVSKRFKIDTILINE
jgi:hypothetical protein